VAAPSERVGHRWGEAARQVAVEVHPPLPAVDLARAAVVRPLSVVQGAVVVDLLDVRQDLEEDGLQRAHDGRRRRPVVGGLLRGVLAVDQVPSDRPVVHGAADDLEVVRYADRGVVRRRERQSSTGGPSAWTLIASLAPVIPPPKVSSCPSIRSHSTVGSARGPPPMDEYRPFPSSRVLEVAFQSSVFVRHIFVEDQDPQFHAADQADGPSEHRWRRRSNGGPCAGRLIRRRSLELCPCLNLLAKRDTTTTNVGKRKWPPGTDTYWAVGLKARADLSGHFHLDGRDETTGSPERMDETRKRARTGNEDVASVSATKAPQSPHSTDAAAAATKIAESQRRRRELEAKVNALQAENKSLTSAGAATPGRRCTMEVAEGCIPDQNRPPITILVSAKAVDPAITDDIGLEVERRSTPRNFTARRTPPFETEISLRYPAEDVSRSV
ncbi:hypothetical protein THAOC_24067, partial [Thalassiosira oceanica]